MLSAIQRQSLLVVSIWRHCAAPSPLLFRQVFVSLIIGFCVRSRFAHLSVCTVLEKLAQTEVSSGSDGPINCTRDEFMEGTDAQKAVFVQAEMQRMKHLPSGSTYNTNRLKLLDKMLHLLGKVRTSTEGEELEVLFANLNF